MKLLRTIQLDASDTFVFAKAAEPGEWAVSGAFVFWDSDPAALEGKMRTAFRSGFLGISTLGWSTLVQIVEASHSDRRVAIEALAGQFPLPSLPLEPVELSEGPEEIARQTAEALWQGLVAQPRG